MWKRFADWHKWERSWRIGWYGDPSRDWKLALSTKRGRDMMEKREKEFRRLFDGHTGGTAGEGRGVH